MFPGISVSVNLAGLYPLSLCVNFIMLWRIYVQYLLDVLLSSIAGYFCELCKIQTTSKNSRRYYTTKRLIRGLLSNLPNYYACVGEFSGYLFTGMRHRSVWSGMELAREIQPTDWLTAGNMSDRPSGVQIPRDIGTCFRRYLYSTKCSWIITIVIDLYVQVMSTAIEVFSSKDVNTQVN